MSSGSIPERLLELACDRALVGLRPAEQLELERLLEQGGELEALELELAAAELDLALAPAPAEPLPSALRAQLLDAGKALIGSQLPHVQAATRELPARTTPTGPAVPQVVVPEAPRATVLPLAGWVLAAAALVLAVLGWLPRRPLETAQPTDHVVAYAELREAPGTSNPTWEATELAAGAGGDVAWSQAEQKGFLHIVGLAPNDPRIEQYQLWILDADQAHPIDGGVFDVRGEEEWVPIDPKLDVGHPTAFAVTIERPGGVVVSDQERIVLLANL
jgi:hypothetical protein